MHIFKTTFSTIFKFKQRKSLFAIQKKRHAPARHHTGDTGAAAAETDEDTEWETTYPVADALTMYCLSLEAHALDRQVIEAV